MPLRRRAEGGATLTGVGGAIDRFPARLAGMAMQASKARVDGRPMQVDRGRVVRMEAMVMQATRRQPMRARHDGLGRSVSSVSSMRSGRRARRGAGWLLAAALCFSVTPSMAEEYEPSNAGHPLRVVAYVVHPVGVVYDYLLLRPAFWVGSHQPFRTLFGRTD